MMRFVQVFASLPLVPSWLVSLPAVAQLALLQDRPVAALLLLAAHFGAWYIADDLILREIPSSHPYLTGLGIFVSAPLSTSQQLAVNMIFITAAVLICNNTAGY